MLSYAMTKPEHGYAYKNLMLIKKHVIQKISKTTLCFCFTIFKSSTYIQIFTYVCICVNYYIQDNITL